MAKKIRAKRAKQEIQIQTAQGASSPKVSIKEKVAALFNDPSVEMTTAQVIEALPGLNPNSVRFMLTQLRSEKRVVEASRKGHMSVLRGGKGNTVIMDVRQGTSVDLTNDDAIVHQLESALATARALVARGRQFQQGVAALMQAPAIQVSDSTS